MQQSGALAVVVGARDFNSPLVSMIGTGDTSDIVVPSVYMLYVGVRGFRAERARRRTGLASGSRRVH